MESGNIITDVEIDIGEGVYACNYSYDEGEKKYLLQRADKKLIWLNPSTGVTEKTADINEALNNMIFDPDNRRVIGMTYNQGTDETSIVVYNAVTGELVSSNVVGSIKGIYSCISGYDEETDCYITLNSDDEVMIIKVLTGEVIKKYKLDYHLNDIKFFRSCLISLSQREGITLQTLIRLVITPRLQNSFTSHPTFDFRLVFC